MCIQLCSLVPPGSAAAARSRADARRSSLGRGFGIFRPRFRNIGPRFRNIEPRFRNIEAEVSEYSAEVSEYWAEVSDIHYRGVQSEGGAVDGGSIIE